VTGVQTCALPISSLDCFICNCNMNAIFLQSCCRTATDGWTGAACVWCVCCAVINHSSNSGLRNLHVWWGISVNWFRSPSTALYSAAEFMKHPLTWDTCLRVGSLVRTCEKVVAYFKILWCSERSRKSYHSNWCFRQDSNWRSLAIEFVWCWFIYFILQRYRIGNRGHSTRGGPSACEVGGVTNDFYEMLCCPLWDVWEVETWWHTVTHGRGSEG
jgi:hypothetical protein